MYSARQYLGYMAIRTRHESALRRAPGLELTDQQACVLRLLTVENNAASVGDFVAFENRVGEVLFGRVIGADVALDVLVPPNHSRGVVRNFRVARDWAIVVSRGAK